MIRGSEKGEKKGRKERERERERNSVNETLDTAPRTVIPGNSMKYSHVQVVAWPTNNYVYSVKT